MRLVKTVFYYCLLVLLMLTSSHLLYGQTYTYDLDGRLTSAVFTNGIKVNYAYDGAGSISNIYPSIVQNTNFPVVTISGPLPDSAPTVLPPVPSGTTSGSNQVIAVFYQVNGGALQMASSINGWANWAASFPYVFGANVFKVYAVDVAGNIGNVYSETIVASGPRLIAALTNGLITLSWPSLATGYSVQSSSSLGDEAIWSPVSGNSTLDGGSFSLTVPASDATKFFRLVNLPVGMVGYWQFNNSTNLGADSSGESNTLITASGEPVYKSDTTFGGALYLDGSSTMGTLSGMFPYGVPTGNSPYTIAVWEKVDTGCQNNGGFVGWGDNNGSQANDLRLNGPNGVDNYWWGNDFVVNGLAVNPMDGNWHAIAVTWDGTTQTMYVDGLNFGSRTPTSPNVQPVNFVVGKTTGDVNFTGWIEDLLIANQVLPQAQIQSYPNWGSLIYTVAQEP